jgi:hypothetical protein
MYIYSVYAMYMYMYKYMRCYYILYLSHIHTHSLQTKIVT